MAIIRIYAKASFPYINYAETYISLQGLSPNDWAHFFRSPVIFGASLYFWIGMQLLIIISLFTACESPNRILVFENAYGENGT